jgi:hypothetical protein
VDARLHVPFFVSLSRPILPIIQFRTSACQQTSRDSSIIHISFNNQTLGHKEILFEIVAQYHRIMGSTGRKRPADQMMSGGEGAASEEPQRPDKKSKSGRKKKDKKRGKGKGKKDGSSSKSNKDGSSASASAGNSLET